ncbi:MAG: hypothetical protein HFJ29_00495 [Clostridia bacterium]|nr:hypothetical protein [Clostridia bacterium]
MITVTMMASAFGLGFLHSFIPGLALPMSIIFGAFIIGLAIKESKK